MERFLAGYTTAHTVTRNVSRTYFQCFFARLIRLIVPANPLVFMIESPEVFLEQERGQRLGKGESKIKAYNGVTWSSLGRARPERCH